ncbi:hypothetical protein HO173_004533 [Letharia columbiana]|uniref:Integral membrane protein n=1 Tax=Letharia columbiana TaxID=112416 RepID=A0A8H6FYI7_9LECA|nr:uncharacterized protein HO173_004533 [Letharia columbiana]KAF6237066.1 hypothetical protein HO173_004533 [Letharia columbiana]
MANQVMVPFLIAMMLLTGVCNTLLSKYQDLQCVANCDSSDPSKIRRFSMPVIQTAQMFIGEAACWLVVLGHYLYKRYISRPSSPLFAGGYTAVNGHDSGIDSDEEDNNEELGSSFSALEAANPVAKSLVPNADGRRELVGWRVILLALPACCDIAGTTLMNVGLLFVAASIYQMTRGALVLFVGLFSVIFLHRKLYLYQWSALFIVVLGVAVVGLAGAIAPNPQAQPEPRSTMEAVVLFTRATVEDIKVTARSTEALWTIIGVLMIALAQIFTATQFVLEEWILEQYALEPLKVVGWEGLFGFIVTVIAMIILHLVVGRTEQGRNGYFDAEEGWREMTHNKAIAVSSVLIMISIGGFNFFGLSVTRTVSATARSTIDTCRTLFIWIVSLGLGWETFKWLQILGFALLVYGTFLFNDIVRPPLKSCIKKRKEEALLAAEPIEHS